ncbi:MAG: hypothetical protein AB7I59_14885 [Geminicoccaceae bacterium]
MPPVRWAVLPAALAFLSGCAGIEYGSNAYDPVQMPGTAEVAARTQYRDYNYLRANSAYQDAVNARIDTLAKAPMTEAAAVEVALLQDRGVQDLMLEHWAQRPSFVADVASRIERAEDPRPVEWKVQGELLSRSTTKRWRMEFGEEYLETTEVMTGAATKARTAYYEAVAAAQLAAMFDQTLDAEKAAAELANEQYRAGTTSRLDQARQHLAYAETVKAVAAANRDAVEKREALNRLLKLHGQQTGWQLPDRLPDLPATRPEFPDLETYATTHSIAAYTGRASTDQLTQGTALRSEVREQYHRMLTAYDIAKFQRDTVVPLTEVALAELQRNYNAMLLDVYELLDATREQIEAGKEYVTSLADFWIAHAELTELMGGALPPAAPATTAAATPLTDQGSTP